MHHLQVNQEYSHQQETWNSYYAKNRRLWKGTPYSVKGAGEGDLILELGCGDGKTTRSPELKFCSLVALDYAQNAIIRCRSLQVPMQDIQYIAGDATNLPFREESFNVVIAFHCLSHMTKEGRFRAKDEIYRVLVKGGTFLFRDFSVEDMRYGHGRNLEENSFIKSNGIFTHFFTEDELINLFSGFLIKKIERCNYYLNIKGKSHTRSDIEIQSGKAIKTV